jgi:hypothetical protein
LQRALTTIVLLGLLLASAAAFAITEHMKLIKSPIYRPVVTKVFSPAAHGKALIQFNLRHRDSVTVSIVDSGRNVIATLPEQTDRPAKMQLTFKWNGLTSAGTVVGNGSVYQPQVHLSNDRHTILMPNRITVDTEAPDVLSASAGGGGILIVGRAQGLPIRYSVSEPAHVAVYLGGRRVLLGRRTKPTGIVKWNGKVDGKMLRPGRYALRVGAVDVAGNETPPAGRKRVVVRIRAIALSGTPTRVAPGSSFAVIVRTGAPKYTWKFAGAHGTETRRLLRLRAPSQRGRYRLVVSAPGHSTTAIVTVGPKE